MDKEKGESMRSANINENVIDGRIYMCVMCCKCKTVLPIAMAIDDNIRTISDKRLVFKASCYQCNHKQNYLAGQAHLARAKNNMLQAP